MSQRTRILAALFIVALALAFFFVMAGARPSRAVPISAVNQIEPALLREGFKVEESFMFKDEMALGPATPAKRWILGAIYPGYQNRGAHRLYVRDGARLGIDFGMRETNLALNMSITTDPPNDRRARQIVRELSALNPNLSISLRTNAPTAAAAQ